VLRGAVTHRLIIIIIIINEKIIVAFSPRTTRTRYKVKKQNLICIQFGGWERQRRYVLKMANTATLTLNIT